MTVQPTIPAIERHPTVRAVVDRLATDFPDVPSERLATSAAYACHAVAFVAEELLCDVRLVQLIARADLDSRLSGRESSARVFGVRQPLRRRRRSAPPTEVP